MISTHGDTDRSVAFQPPKYVNTLVATGAAQTVTVPALVLGVVPGQAVVSSTGNVYSRFDGGTAAIPSGTVTDGTGSMLNATYFVVSPGQTISMIAAGGTVITIAFYGA